MRVLIVGGGWAGLSAAVRAIERGWQVTLLEASRQLGGRARVLQHERLALDNGQHILIGAYTRTLDLMRTVGLDPDRLLLRLPLRLQTPDGRGLSLPDLPAPWHLLLGVVQAKGWNVADKWSLLRTALQWQRQSFRCDPGLTVAQCCAPLTPAVMRTLIEPLCVSALNTPVDQASGDVFLRVLHDALWSGGGSSDLLLPQVDLGSLLPDAAQRWLSGRGAHIRCGQRWAAPDASRGMDADAVVLACPAWEAARLTAQDYPEWSRLAAQLRHEAIATVYLRHPDLSFGGLSQPCLALSSDPAHPAQFVFDKGQLLGPAFKGVLACVVSASQGSREAIEQAVLAQARKQLRLPALQALLTVVEKRATFACTPDLQRPGAVIGTRWWACGDYVQGPYPATLEGAIRSGAEVIDQIAQAGESDRRR